MLMLIAQIQLQGFFSIQIIKGWFAHTRVTVSSTEQLPVIRCTLDIAQTDISFSIMLWMLAFQPDKSTW